MHKFMINGQKRLSGTVRISGSKNASLPIMAATLLTKDDVVLENVPDLMDIKTMKELLEILGKKVEINGNSVRVKETNAELYEAPYDVVRKMRASIAVMGPLLARKGKAKISFPGGCAIGPRPIDLHLRGMKALGTDILVEHGYVWAQAKELVGAKMNLLGTNGPSVLATENVMMAAVLAKGKTIIQGCAAEPEVDDLANFLIAMGAKIKGAGSPIIEIEGVETLHGANYRIIPDRIEAGTFIAAAGITGGEIKLTDICVSHLDAVIEAFSKAGVEFELLDDNTLVAKGAKITPVELETMPYPYFPTDLQAQLMAMVSLSSGISIIKENIFPDRFMHAPELNRMGADIRVEGPTAVIKGVERLSGAAVMASDLRAGAGLVVAALAARGKSEILRIYHIDRGYENLEKKFLSLGADIERVPS